MTAIANQFQGFFFSFFLSLILTPVVIYFSQKSGLVALPREDRWHKNPTALFGGIAIFFAFIIPFILNLGTPKITSALLLLGGTAFFLIGLLDDLLEFSPQGKFLAQLVTIVALVGFGLKVNFPGYPVLSIFLSIFWLIGVTNAINILDNMDGLSSGIVMIASFSLALYGNFFGIWPVILPSLILSGACLGFFIYNFKPAKIFMGDCGSLFLGYMLGSLALLSVKDRVINLGANGLHGSSIMNMVLMLAIPVAVLIIPIFDTALVSFTRVQTGRSIAQGGRDHTSHRLVLLGLSEEKTVLTLMLASAFISFLALYMARHSLDGLLAVLSITAIISIFFGVFLTHLNADVYPRGDERERDESKILTAMSLVLNKKQILQVCVDIVLITIAYYSSYLLKFDGVISEYNRGLIAKSLPLVYGIKISCFWALGLYRGQWRFASLDDTFKIIKATLLSSSIIVGALVFFYRFEGYSRVVFFIDSILTFMFIGGVRFLLRMFNEYFIRQAEKKHSIPVLIYGAGDGGDLFLRELRKRRGHDYLPIGFIDDDKAKLGQEIHGVKVIGTGQDLERLICRYGIKVIFVTILTKPFNKFEDLSKTCKKLGVKCIKMRPLVSFDELCQNGERGKKRPTKLVVMKR